MASEWPLLLNGRLVAERVGIPRDWAYDLIRSGAFGPVVRIHRAQLVSRERVERWVKEQTELDDEDTNNLPDVRLRSVDGPD